MQKDKDLLDHVNKVKAFTNQLVCLNIAVKNENIIMTMLESLPVLFKYLITVIGTMPMNELMMVYVTTRLVHEMLKRKEKEP